MPENTCISILFPFHFHFGHLYSCRNKFGKKGNGNHVHIVACMCCIFPADFVVLQQCDTRKYCFLGCCWISLLPTVLGSCPGTCLAVRVSWDFLEQVPYCKARERFGGMIWADLGVPVTWHHDREHARKKAKYDPHRQNPQEWACKWQLENYLACMLTHGYQLQFWHSDLVCIVSWYHLAMWQKVARLSHESAANPGN